MKARIRIELLVYSIVIVLSLVAAGLAIVSPPAFSDLQVVYGGF